MNICNDNSLILLMGALQSSLRSSKFSKCSRSLLFMQTSSVLSNKRETLSSTVTSPNAAFLLFFASSIKSKCSHHLNNPPKGKSPPHTHLKSPNHRKNNKAHRRKSSPLTTARKKIEFDKWTQELQRGFQPEDVVQVLNRQTDIDVAFDIFRWASQQKRYKHNHLTYQVMIQKLADETSLDKMEILINEVMAGACDGAESLYNSMIYVCTRAHWLGRAISVYRHMRKSLDCKPSLKTYNLLLTALLNIKTNNSYITYMYVQNMRALFKQMIDANVDPDIFTLNIMIKGYANSLHVNDALRIFHQIEGVYGCSPNIHTYNYLIRGLCLQSRTMNAMEIYREMMGKGFVPSSMVYNSLVNCLTLSGESQEAIQVLREMLDNGGVPDFITYKTLGDELFREGKMQEASELLHEFHLKDCAFDGISYRKLLNHLHSRSDTMDPTDEKLVGD